MKCCTFSLAFIATLRGADICYFHQECDMGCFTDDPPWGGTEARPNKNLPEPPGTINTKFILDTPGRLGSG